MVVCWTSSGYYFGKLSLTPFGEFVCELDFKRCNTDIVSSLVQPCYAWNDNKSSGFSDESGGM